MSKHFSLQYNVVFSVPFQVMVTRGLASLAGVITIGLAILTSSGIDGVLQLGNTAMSVLAGPLLALYLLGFFTHTANRLVKYQCNLSWVQAPNYK